MSHENEVLEKNWKASELLIMTLQGVCDVHSEVLTSTR